MMSWLTDIIRWIFFQIDNIVYGLISILYELLMYLANLDLFGISSMLVLVLALFWMIII